MADYAELVKALRCCSKIDARNNGCDSCPYETGWWVKMTCDCTKVGEHKHGGKIYKANEYVTHWMPLPEAPKEDAE